jgi:hypothetical protein
MVRVPRQPLDVNNFAAGSPKGEFQCVVLGLRPRRIRGLMNVLQAAIVIGKYCSRGVHTSARVSLSPSLLSIGPFWSLASTPADSAWDHEHIAIPSAPEEMWVPAAGFDPLLRSGHTTCCRTVRRRTGLHRVMGGREQITRDQRLPGLLPDHRPARLARNFCPPGRHSLQRPRNSILWSLTRKPCFFSMISSVFRTRSSSCFSKSL